MSCAVDLIAIANAALEVEKQRTITLDAKRKSFAAYVACDYDLQDQECAELYRIRKDEALKSRRLKLKLQTLCRRYLKARM